MPSIQAKKQKPLATIVPGATCDPERKGGAQLVNARAAAKATFAVNAAPNTRRLLVIPPTSRTTFQPPSYRLLRCPVLGAASTIGDFHCPWDGNSFLPEDWPFDRAGCREVGIPGEVAYRPKWKIAFEPFDRAGGNVATFDWLTFDEGVAYL